MPGFKSATDYDERRFMRVDCDKVYDGIILGNGDTICNMDYLKGIGVTHVLNTAERHVEVNPAKYPCYGIQYYGFHVDDLPEANISRWEMPSSCLGSTFYLFTVQVFPHNHRLHRQGSPQWWSGYGKLLHGLVQVCHVCSSLPHDEA